MTAGDEGGEAPCFLHLLDEPSDLADEAPADLVRKLDDADVIADAEGTIRNDAAARGH